MLQLIDSWRRRDENGASAVEYGLLVAGIAALIVLVIFALGGTVRSIFSRTCSDLQSRASVSSASSCNS